MKISKTTAIKSLISLGVLCFTRSYAFIAKDWETVFENFWKFMGCALAVAIIYYGTSEFFHYIESRDMKRLAINGSIGAILITGWVTLKVHATSATILMFVAG